MSFDGVVGYSPVPSVRLPSWPTPKFFNRTSYRYLESPSTWRILNESNGNRPTTNSANGKVERRKDNGTMTPAHLPPEMENSKEEDYLRSWQPQNKSNHMMQMLFDSRPEPETDEKPIRLTENEYRSMTAQLRDARQVVAHSKSISNTGLTPTTKNHEIYRTQLAISPRAVRDKTWRPNLLQPCLLQQSFKGYISDHLIDSSGRKTADDKHHKIVITTKARLNPSRAIDPKLVTMISQTPSTEIEVPRDLPTNQSSSGEEDDHPINPGRPPGKDQDSDSTSSDDDSHFFLTDQTKSSQRTKDEAAADRDEYRFATPLSEDLMRLDLAGMSRAERDWRTLTNVRPKFQTEARILDRLIQMERFQTQTVELENGLRRPIGLRINSNSLLQAAPGKNARGRVPSRRGNPDFDNTRKSNAAPASADLICQLCLERHAVRSCVDNVYASRSRSTIDFDKYERATPQGPSNRMGPTVQGRSSNPLAPGAFRGRARLTNAGRAVRVNEYAGSTSLPLQPLQRVDEYASTIGGSTSAQAVDAPSDLIGAFNVLGLQIGQSSKGGEYSSLKPTLTSNEVASGSRTVAGAAKGNLVIPTVNYRKTPSIVDVEVRTLKPPRLKSATRTLKPGSKRRPQTAN